MIKSDLPEAFFSATSSIGAPTETSDREAIEQATADPHYGFIMRDTLPYATSLIETGSGATLPLDRLPAALGISARLLIASGEGYRDEHQRPHNTPLRSEWEEHENNVREGKIVTLQDLTLWMSPEASREQVVRADSALSGATTQDQRLLAALNYGLYFNEKTMAGVPETLATTPDTIATATSLESMPHLTVTNWAIGETVQHIYEHMATQPKGDLHVVDMGSGSGATLATITNRLSQAEGTGRVGITSFEATPAFYKQLQEVYWPTATEQLGNLGMKWLVQGEVGKLDPTPRAGRIVLSEGDVVEGVRRLNLSALKPDDIVMGTANYAFHRLPSRQKQQIIKRFSEADNSILVIGDLRQNGSKVNRGYFNMTNNGPLNAGNIGLDNTLQNAGYLTETIGVGGFVPPFIDDSLYRRLIQELGNDGFFTIAYKGPQAEESLFAKPAIDLAA